MAVAFEQPTLTFQADSEGLGQCVLGSPLTTMSIFTSSLESWKNPYYPPSTPSSLPSSIFAQPPKPGWFTPVFLRAWDQYSPSRLQIFGEDDLYGDFLSPAFSAVTDFESTLDSFEKRQVRLEAHATNRYNNAEDCFVSMTTDWEEVMRHARRLHDNQRREGGGYTYLTAINAEKLIENSPWKVLSMAEEMERYHVDLSWYNITGKPWEHQWYQDEILAIGSIPNNCIITTFRVEGMPDWQTGAYAWRDQTLIPHLYQQWGFVEGSPFPKPFLFKI